MSNPDDRDREIAELRAQVERLSGAKPPAPKAESPTGKSSSASSGSAIRWLLGAVGLVAVLGLFGYLSSTVTQPAPADSGTPTSEAVAAAAAAASADKASDAATAAMAAARASETKWTYSDDGDAMHDAKTHTACTTSTNQAELSAPYSPVTAELCLRRKPGGKLDAYVRLDGDGQILCGIEECSTPVRFDKGAITHFPSVGAADGSSNIIFLNRTSGLVAALRRSTKTVIQLRLYQNGDQALEFDTAGLKW